MLQQSRFGNERGSKGGFNRRSNNRRNSDHYHCNSGCACSCIAVALVGSNFAGLSGASLTSACLAYLGGGAIAIEGAGMAGGTIAIDVEPA